MNHEKRNKSQLPSNLRNLRKSTKQNESIEKEWKKRQNKEILTLR